MVLMPIRAAGEDEEAAGKCVEPPKNCRKAPEVYCKQGLCVFREKAGQVNPASSAKP